MFNASPNVMTISTLDEGRFVEVNQAFCDAAGYEREELVGRTSLEMNFFLDPDDRNVIKDALIRGDRVSGLEVRLRTKTDDERIYLCSCEPIEIEGKACILSAASDITDRKEAEKEKAQLESQLHQTQKMEAVGQLAGGVAHDFNNILTTILGNVELSIDQLKEAPKPDDILLQRLLEIDKGAKRASTLTRQLLAFSRRQVAQPTILELNVTLSEMEKMLRRLITEDIELTTSFDPELHDVRADAGQMEQVLMNLVVNARDAIPDGGTLTIETANITLDEDYCKIRPEVEPGDYVMLAVRDTGCGMHPHMVWRIFEPFYTTKPTGTGTGLGLSTVYGIVKQTHGHIAVYSEPDHGTTFRIYLPAMKAATPSDIRQSIPISHEEDPIRCGSETILVSEDDDHVRGLIELMLESAGYNVLPALNGTQALSPARESNEPIDLLITDVIMPDMNGKKLSEAMTELRPGLRTLFISGYTSNVIAHHGVIDEGVEFLSKPFTRAKLLARVRDVIEQQARTWRTFCGKTAGEQKISGPAHQRVLRDDGGFFLSLIRLSSGAAVGSTLNTRLR